jgi:DNA-binding NtrC family response regulator
MDGVVLVIHDEQALRAAARQALTLAGRQVAEAAAIGAALKLADRVRPAVIVLPWLGRRPVREALAQLREADATRRSRLIVWAEQADMPSAVAAL